MAPPKAEGVRRPSERDTEGKTGTPGLGEMALGCTCLSIIHCPTLCPSLIPLAFALTLTMRGQSKPTQGCFLPVLEQACHQIKTRTPVVTNVWGPWIRREWRPGRCLVIGPWQLRLYLASGEALGPLLGNKKKLPWSRRPQKQRGDKEGRVASAPGSRKERKSACHAERGRVGSSGAKLLTLGKVAFT